MLSIIIVCSIMVCNVPVYADDEIELKKLQQEFFEWSLKDSPEFATSIGDFRYNDRVKDYSMLQLSKRKKSVESFITKILKIGRNNLSRNVKYSYDITLHTMKTFVDNYKWRLYGALNPLTKLEGFQTDPEIDIRYTPFNTKGDFENYIARLVAYPNQIEQIISRFNEAIRLRRTYHNVSIDNVPLQLAKLIVTDPRNSVYFTPFKHTLTQLHIPQSEKDDIIKSGGDAIVSYIKSIQVLKQFLEKKYIPNTRISYGVYGWQDGSDYYKACLKWHLTTDMSPAEVHQKGLEEVKRIKEKITKIMKEKEGFTGSISQFTQQLQARPSLHKSSGKAILNEYRRIIDHIIYPKLPTMFKDVPNLKVVVEAEPYDGPAGQYIIGTEDGSRPGIFQVNVLKPNETLSFSMMALTLHETVPGHHLQGSYALKADLPRFQKNIDYGYYNTIPYHFPFYTSYTEGWGLYAESLGEDMGLYKDYLELIGRYGYEIFRAGRLVVDTGLHYFKWSRAQAVQYMVDNSPMALSEIELEIDRYITWPGQACAYKIGELKIRELREKAKLALGSMFDIKEFHALVLTHGPVPLIILETMVNDWIQDLSQHKGTLIG